ncbi:MAG: hypothetical protein ACI4SB_06950 [Acutalibacteraceae bacterium]
MVDKRILDFLLSEDWKNKKFDITDQWDELISNKYAFTDNEDNVNLEEFAVLAQDTYNIAEELRYASINLNEETTAEYVGHPYGNHYESFTRLKKNLLIFYAKIIACVRAYSVMDCFTENLEYKASIAVARELSHLLSSVSSAQREPVLSMTLDDGEFWLDRDYSEEELNKEYTYDIREHDFSEMLAFAERIN